MCGSEGKWNMKFPEMCIKIRPFSHQVAREKHDREE